VSKNELDFALMRGKQLLFHREVGNRPEAIRAFLKELGKQTGFALGKAVFYMEHTVFAGVPVQKEGQRLPWKPPRRSKVHWAMSVARTIR